MELSRGQKVKQENLNNIKVSVLINSNIDISCFGVDSDDKLKDDRYFVLSKKFSK